MRWKLETRPAVCQPIDTGGLDVDLQSWLARQADSLGLEWLLAHADDGVIWGKVVGGNLVTAYDATIDHPGVRDICPPLRETTLQQARLFAQGGELFLWRNAEQGWQARLIREVRPGEEATWEECCDEAQLLWGTHGQALSQGFTLLTHGSQGQRHVLPLPLDLRDGAILHTSRLPRLVVRHYLARSYVAAIVASRLVKLQA